MNQPLGNYVGNALEVYEAIEILSGRAEGDLKTVSLMLGAHILRLAGVVSTVDEGVRMLEEKIRSGEGLKKLSELFACEGGDPRVPYEPDRLPKAPKQIMSERPVTMSALSIGMLLSVSQNVLVERRIAWMPMQARRPMIVATTEAMSAMVSEL